MSKIINAWQAVELSKYLGHRPLRIMFQGQPVVLFRNGTTIAALTDMCPHRLVELSKGRVVGGEIECPYHGWRFNGGGALTHIPCSLEKLPHYKVKNFSAIEKAGVIFLSDGKPNTEPHAHSTKGDDIILHHLKSNTVSTLVDAAENILDATHTHYTHKGLLRGFGTQRYKVKVEVTGGDGFVEATYTGEEKQQGLISKLLTGEATKTIGRFLYPGIVELEYWSGNKLALATAFHLRQSEGRTIEGIGILSGHRQWGIGYLKAWALRPMLHIALQQDRRILKSASENAKRFPDAKPIIGPLDFLRRDIESIMNGELPSAATKPIIHYLEL